MGQQVFAVYTRGIVHYTAFYEIPFRQKKYFLFKLILKGLILKGLVIHDDYYI